MGIPQIASDGPGPHIFAGRPRTDASDVQLQILLVQITKSCYNLTDKHAKHQGGIHPYLGI